MAMTRDFKETVKSRAQRDPGFAKALLDKAATAFLNGEPDVARLILRDLVNASLGFETLAIETNKPSKSLHRMLSERGNPSMDNLAAIFGAVRKSLSVDIEARVVEAAQSLRPQHRRWELTAAHLLLSYLTIGSKTEPVVIPVSRA